MGIRGLRGVNRLRTLKICTQGFSTMKIPNPKKNLAALPAITGFTGSMRFRRLTGSSDPSFDAQSSTYICKVNSVFPKTGWKPVKIAKNRFFIRSPLIELFGPSFDIYIQSDFGFLKTG